jgi:NCS1 family nucleobase:cation symporter-1
MVADFFLLRRRHIDLRALYDDDPSSKYGFWHHFNPAGIAALVAGFLTYVLILNPQTLESRGAFELFTASVPSLVVGAGVHLVLTKLVVQPLGWGGYAAPRRRVAERGAVRA